MSFTQDQVLALIGPTNVGKTSLALELARHYPLEIISLDSALVYKDMDIGTAKPSPRELKLVPHHLIDICTPLETYNAASFVKDCRQLIRSINERNKLALIVGGTMMYYHALVNGLNQLPPADQKIRNSLHQKKQLIGLSGLYQKLKEVDPAMASRVGPGDSQRIERALEVFYLTQKPMSSFFIQTPVQSRQKTIPTIAIIPKNRGILHQAIEQRFLAMLQRGLIEEIKGLKLKYPTLGLSYPSMRCVGYRQVWEYLTNSLSYDQMLQQAIAATRQLAKRQLTWLKKFAANKQVQLYYSTEVTFKQLKTYLFEHVFSRIH
ncbi:MAG: tRNA (adenosine(37)-N6)-dimethylallyltransferase MiaA [Neisseriaceae bacterium]